jgi:hypothetical protein
MKLPPGIGLLAVLVLSFPATAAVTVTRSDEGVVLENSVVRVELPRERNFQPSVLIDQRNPRRSLIEDVGFSAWDVPQSDWMTSATCDWQVTVSTHQADNVVWCETMLTRQPADAGRTRFTLRTTVREQSPAVEFDFQTEFQAEHVQRVGLRIQAREYRLAEWSTAWGQAEIELIGRKNSFHALLGFRNGLALTQRQQDAHGGLLLFHNSAWNTVFPTLRKKSNFVRYIHPTLTSPAQCSVTLVPFSGTPALAESTGKWGRSNGVGLLSLPANLPTREKAHHDLTEADRKRGFVAFGVAPFETVLPDSLPVAGTVPAAMKIRACAGEYEPVSFAIRALKPLGRLTLNASDLVCGDSRIPADAINAHVVKVWQQAGPPTSADATMGAGSLVPELLLKDDRVNLTGSRPDVRLDGPVETSLDANVTKQFWLTVRVPDQLPPGRYRGNVTVSPSDAAAVQIPLQVDVLPFVLAPSRKKQGIWFKAERRTATREYVERDVYRRLLEDVRAHGMQFVTIRGRGMGIAEDVLTIHEAAGMRGLTIWSSWFPSAVADFGPLRENLETAVRRHGYQQLYFQATDEPNSEEQIALARTYFSKVKAAGGRTFCNITPQYAVRLGDRLDIPCVGYSNFFGSLERQEPVPGDESDALTQLLKTHSDVWYYWQCRVEDPRINRLLFGFLLMKSPATGAMPYTYSTLGAETPFDDWSALRDGQISRAGSGAVYHTRAGSLPTVQWDAAREGIDDARYVCTLENLIDEARQQAKFATSADRAAQTLKSLYTQLPPHFYQALKSCPAHKLDSFRSEIITAILKLRAAMAN